MKDKIDKKMDEDRAKRVKLKSNLPKTNKDLFLKLKDQESGEMVKKKQREAASNLLKDDRFTQMFTDDRFQVSNVFHFFILKSFN